MALSAVEGFPWFRFDPVAWLQDEKLRQCSPAARGIWIDLLCWMWLSKAPGVLILPVDVPEDRAIARVLGMDPRMSRRLMAELWDREVPRRVSEEIYRMIAPTLTDHCGIIDRSLIGLCCSRRMLSEFAHAAASRRKRSVAGKLGAAGRWGRRKRGDGNAIGLRARVRSKSTRAPLPPPLAIGEVAAAGGGDRAKLRVAVADALAALPDDVRQRTFDEVVGSLSSVVQDAARAGGPCGFLTVRRMAEALGIEDGEDGTDGKG